MTQGEIDILAAEVGLQPVALPAMKLKAKDKMERLQRKSTRPLGRGERVRNLRPAQEGAAAGERPARQAREEAPRKSSRGSTVAERPSEMRKRPAKPEGDKPAGRGRGKPRG